MSHQNTASECSGLFIWRVHDDQRVPFMHMICQIRRDFLGHAKLNQGGDQCSQGTHSQRSCCRQGRPRGEDSHNGSSRDKQSCQRKEESEEGTQHTSPDSTIDRSCFDGMTGIRIQYRD